jgi:prepilin-type N-terminal cleavage/methylation domain-containing protein
MISYKRSFPSVFVNKTSGFTLLEILVTVAIITILAGIVIVAMNPMRQLSVSRDYDRVNAVQQLYKAVHQYYIDHGSYPARVNDDTLVYEMCNTNFVDVKNCGLSTLSFKETVPDYLPGIPVDPYLDNNTSTGYRIAINKNTGVYVEAPNTEIGIGASSTVIHVGRPPFGYDIPMLVKVEDAVVSDISLAPYIDPVKQASPWTKYLFVFVIGLGIGYKISKKKYCKIASKNTKPLPTVFIR